MGKRLFDDLLDIRRDEARLRLLRYLSERPNASTRQMAAAIGVSNGAAYYLLKALLDKGLVKARNFVNAERKSHYVYELTPSGLKQRLHLTERFLVLKRQEYEALKLEIAAMEADLCNGRRGGSLVDAATVGHMAPGSAG